MNRRWIIYTIIYVDQLHTELILCKIARGTFNMEVVIHRNVGDRYLLHGTVCVESSRMQCIQCVDFIYLLTAYFDHHFANVLIALQILDLQYVRPQVIREAIIIRLDVFECDRPLWWIRVLVDHEAYSDIQWHSTSHTDSIIETDTLFIPTRLIVIIDIFSPADITHQLVWCQVDRLKSSVRADL